MRDQTPETDVRGRRVVPPVTRRLRVAEALAVVALISAFVGALGPATETRSTYSWPPSEVPQETPKEGWYTPLLLAARIPERLEVSVPCMSRPLRETAQEAVVLATTRRADREDALTVVRTGRDLVVNVADETLARLPSAAPGTDNSRCEYRLQLADGRWRLEGGPDGVMRAGDTPMPVVNGLFSEADLRTASRLQVRVTTSPHTPRTTTRQKIATSIAMISGLLALILASGIGQGSMGAGIRHTWVRLTRAAGIADVVVVGALLAWWILAPAHIDDGWTIARQSSFATTNEFSNYYESFGVGLPLGYWLEWLQHWFTQTTSALVLLRIPTLVALVATWIVCRWGFSEVSRDVPGNARLRTPLWAMTCGFLAMAMAWGMTLRAEPWIALLVAVSMACCIRFLRRPSAAPLALCAAIVPLSLSGHPAGIVAVAPLFVVAPSLFRWARSHLPAGVAIVVASGALLLALAFVGSDIELRARSAQTLNAASTTVTDWRDEIVRYDVLVQARDDQISGNAAPLRQAAVALMLLAALAVVLRRRRDQSLHRISPGSRSVSRFCSSSPHLASGRGTSASCCLVAVATAVATARICREQELGARTRTALHTSSSERSCSRLAGRGNPEALGTPLTSERTSGPWVGNRPYR